MNRGSACGVGRSARWRWLRDASALFAVLALLMPATARAFDDSDYDDQGEPIGFWIRQREGWFWYRDPPLPAARPKPAEPPRSTPDAQRPTPNKQLLVDFDAMQKRLEELKKIAVMAPTEGNLKAYMSFQKLVMDKSSVFADAWQRVVWTDPAFDHATQGRPVNNFGLQAYDAKRHDDERATLAELAQTHGLFFFFRSDCPYCDKFAPVLSRFAADTGMQVFPVSLDGGGLPEYPAPAADNGIATRLQVASVPALYLATPSLNQIQPIGFGVMSDGEIAHRIHVLTRMKAEERF